MNSGRLLAAASLFLATGCGWIEAGSGTLNEAEPTGGTIIATAPFTGISGVSVSGTVTIYDMSNGAYIIRLAGLVAPAENGLSIVPVVNGISGSSLALRSTTGTQNYSLQVSGSNPHWEKVRLHSAPANRDYAEALFNI